MTQQPPEVQVREINDGAAVAERQEERPRFVARKTAAPVRQADMITVDDEDVDLESVNKPDALEELLALDADREIETEVDMTPEFKGKWVVKAMSNDLNVRLVEQATYVRENPRTHEQIRQMDNVEFSRLVVAHCVKEPNLLDPRLFKKHGVSTRHPDQLVAKMLLPGQIDRLAGSIMRLSGFRDDLVETAKNSSRKVD